MLKIPTYAELESRIRELEQAAVQHKQIEEKLLENLTILQTAMDHCTAGIAIADAPDGKLRYVNDAGLMVRGKSKEEVVNTIGIDQYVDSWQLFHFDGTPCAPDEVPLARALMYGETCDKQFIVRRSGNEDRIVWAHAAPVRNHDGEVISAIVVFPDITAQKEAEKALQKNEAHLRTLIETIPDLVWLKDPEGIYISCNLKFERFFGAKEAEIKGKTDHDFVEKELADFFRRQDMEAMAAESPNVNEEEITYAGDGHKEILETIKVPMHDSEGNLIGVLGVGRDITERKQVQETLQKAHDELDLKVRARTLELRNELQDRRQAEESLKASEQRLRQIIDMVPHFIFAKDIAGRFILVNRAVAEAYGTTVEALTGKTDADFASSDEEVRYFREHDLAVIESGRPHVIPDECITDAQGAVRNLSTVKIPFTFSGTDSPAVLGISTDITACKQVEAEINKFRTISDKAVHGNAIVDLQGDIIYVNDYFAGIHGYNAKELTGRNLALFHNEKQMASVLKINQDLIKNGSYGPLEVWHTHKDGTEFPMLMSGIIIADDSGTPGFMAATAIDITDRKKMEMLLQQAQKMEAIGTLAGGIAHDFNNILFPIVGISELLLQDLPPDSLEYKNIQEIFKAGQRGGDLARQILAFGRQSAHKPIPVLLQQILKEVLKLCRSTIPANIEMSQDIRGDCGMVLADPTQLHQIAMNLITNAFHAVEDAGGEISVQLKETELKSDDMSNSQLEPGRYALLSISDTGYGIDPTAMDKIFEPYFSTKEQGKGTGLGLSVVYGIIQESRGDIKVESELDKGSTFTIYLPIIEESPEIVSTPKDIHLDMGSERILLVDDEEAIALIEKQMLERLGYSVVSRTSSVEALEAFRANPDTFDLVVTDMAMPNITGDQLTEELISITPGIPVIVCTGFSERINQAKAKALGIRGFLMKPVILSEMAQVVRTVLDETKARTHN